MENQPMAVKIAKNCIELSPDAYKYSEGKKLRVHPDNKYWPAFERLVALEGLYAQAVWERDVAVMQLHDLGYAFGEKIDPSKSVSPDTQKADTDPQISSYQGPICTTSETKTCPFCGETMPIHSRTCPKCSTLLEENPKAE